MEEVPEIKDDQGLFVRSLNMAPHTWTAAPDPSIIGKFAGGIFVWAMAILDAYKTARLRAAIWQKAAESAAV